MARRLEAVAVLLCFTVVIMSIAILRLLSLNSSLDTRVNTNQGDIVALRSQVASCATYGCFGATPVVPEIATSTKVVVTPSPSPTPVVIPILAPPFAAVRPTPEPSRSVPSSSSARPSSARPTARRTTTSAAPSSTSPTPSPTPSTVNGKLCSLTHGRVCP